MGCRYVKIEHLKADMMVDRGLYNRYGSALVMPGTVLKGYEIQALRARGVKGLYIRTDTDDNDEFHPDELPPLAQANIDFHQEEDPSQVTFNNEVKDRISKGIEFLYNNVDSPEMDQAASSITHEIMDAIDTNNAVAVDLNILKASDEYTFKHSVDVATISIVVAKHLGFNHQQTYEMGIAALLHDVGKSKIPLNILNKAGKLDDEEFEVMKKHPVYGYQILRDRNQYDDIICLSVLQHHEKINGSGYPFGHDGKSITPYAKVISVADIYDALVTDRPYKKAFSQGDAIEMVMSLSSEIDIKTMDAFLNSVILYPVGTIVRLSTGEAAQVVKNYGNTPLRPKVVGLKTGKVYNLHDDMACINMVIVGILRHSS